MSRNILVVMSSDTALPLQGGQTHTTGFFLNEFGVPAYHLVQAGHRLTIATPQGDRPQMDHGSDTADYFKDDAEYQQIRAFVNDLLNQGVIKLADAAQDLGTYDALFLPGGHAPMIELMRNPDLRRALTHFHERALPTGLICHAPIALLAAQQDAPAFQAELEAGRTPGAQGFLYDGYQATIFSNPEEADTEKNFEAPMLYYPADALRAAGIRVQNADKWSSNVVRDRELITGQNPMSDEEFVKVFLNALNEEAKA